MTFIRFWIGFTMVGLATAVLLLMWALRRRQFGESDRAGYLALEDIPDESEEDAPRASRDTKVLAGIFGVGLLALIASVFFSLFLTGEE